MRRPKLVHERRVQMLAFLGGLPAALVSLIILWTGSYTPKVQWTLTVLIAVFWLGCAASVRERVASPLRTLANLLEAIREGDYSIRARVTRGDDALAEVMQQANLMGATLRAQRLGAVEATTLLRKVMEEIEVAVFTFDDMGRLRFINRAGERLLNTAAERATDLGAAQLGLAEWLEGEPTRIVQRAFAGGAGRWGVSRTSFREGGRPHHLLVISDLTRPLREEELQAWQRLVRVLGHELNNSLTPIKSIAGSLAQIIGREPLPDDWRDDAARGLSIIAARSEALIRFMAAYARLAKLPRPVFAAMDVRPWVERVARLETRLAVQVTRGPDLTIEADRDQLEQLLINLVRNAADAALATGGVVNITWRRAGAHLEVVVTDGGPGLSNTANLFVPFFTTKPGGSGIGLVLSRQIAEGHGGALTLENRKDGPGCEARLRLPV
jgi:nitrogen fixation/metabolism regulation signal transduction histidine kinase